MSAANGTNNEGHGHVYPRPDGVRARCSGTMGCSDCQADFARKAHEDRSNWQGPGGSAKNSGLPFTNAQAEVFAAAKEDAKVRVKFLVEAINKASAAIVKLPHVNESGERVVHGCNLRMLSIIENYTRELSSLKFMWGIRE